MELSPQDHEKILDLMAEKLVQRVEDRLGDKLFDIVGIPTTALAPMLGITTRSLTRNYPVTATTRGKHVVTLRHLLAHQAENTRFPANSPHNPPAAVIPPAAAGDSSA